MCYKAQSLAEDILNPLLAHAHAHAHTRRGTHTRTQSLYVQLRLLRPKTRAATKSTTQMCLEKKQCKRYAKVMCSIAEASSPLLVSWPCPVSSVDRQPGSQAKMQIFVKYMRVKIVVLHYPFNWIWRTHAGPEPRQIPGAIS